MTATTMTMLETYPAEITLDCHHLGETIDALIACSEVCTACADECGRHANAPAHCQVCAQACRTCEQACRALVAEMAG